MSNEIQRVQYLDRQILRAADLQAEQAYHRGLRWRNNRALHLDGIVAGLTLEPFSNTVIVNPGMALDAWGREVFLTQAVTIDERHLPPGAKDGTYSVVLRYAQQPPTASSSPSECDSASTNRLTEEGAISLVLPGLPSSAPEQFFLEPPDNPRRSAPVILGAVSVGKTQGSRRSFAKSMPQPALKYVGLRGQRLLPPDYHGGTERKVVTTENHIAAMEPLGFSVSADLFAERDIVIGENFGIKSNPLPQPELGEAIKKPGHLKVAGDGFFQGRIYVRKKPEPNAAETWVSVQQTSDTLEKDIADLKATMSRIVETQRLFQSQFGRAIPQIVSVPDLNAPIPDENPNDPQEQERTFTIQVPSIPSINSVSAIVMVADTELSGFSPPADPADLSFTRSGIFDIRASGKSGAQPGVAELTIKFKVGRTWRDTLISGARTYRCEFRRVRFSAFLALNPPPPAPTP